VSSIDLNFSTGRKELVLLQNLKLSF